MYMTILYKTYDCVVLYICIYKQTNRSFIYLFIYLFFSVIHTIYKLPQVFRIII